MYKLFFLLSMCPLTAFGQSAGGSRTPFMSTLNSTTTPLAAGETWTGEWEQCFHWSNISVASKIDLDGTLKIQFSPDKVNVDSTLTYQIESGNFEPPHKLEIFRAFCRVTYTNDGAITNTYLRIQTLYGAKGVPVSPLNSVIDKDGDATVVRAISDELLIAEGLLYGYSINLKFGKNSSIDSATVPEDIWGGGGVYTGFPTGTPELVEVVSSSGSDADGGVGCEKLTIYGLDANGVEQSEEITLSGLTPADSVGTYSRVNRGVCTQSANGANTAFNVGIITVRWTTTTAVVFAAIPAGANQTQVACYTVPAGKIGFIRGIHLQVAKSQTRVIEAALWIRENGAPPRLVDVFSASNDNDFDDDMYGGVPLGALADVCMRVISTNGNGTTILAHVDILVIEL